MNVISSILFLFLFGSAIIKNSMWVAGSPFEELMTNCQLVLIVLIVFVTTLFYKIKGTVQAALVIPFSFLFLLRLIESEGIAKEYIQLPCFFLLCLCLYNTPNIIKVVRIIAWFYFLVCSSILVTHVTGLVYYELIEYAERKRLSLGFRNINTFTFYCYVVVFTSFLIKDWLLLILSLLLLIYGSILTDTRTPLYTILFSIVYLIVTTLVKRAYFLPKLTGYFTFILVTTLGISSVLLINPLYNNGFGELNGEQVDLLSSGRIGLLHEITKGFTTIDWLIGKRIAEERVDSLFFNFIGSFGIFFFSLVTILIFYRLRKLLNSHQFGAVTVIISFWLFGLAESPITPYNIFAIMLFSIILFGDINRFYPIFR